MLDAFKTNGSSPPANYRVKAVTFRLVREGPAPRTLLDNPATVADMARQRP